MASNTITITLNGDNGDANYESSVVLVEDAARNATYEAGYDAECLSTDPSGILGVMIYGFVGTKKCEFIYSNDLHGIEFGFTSNVTETKYHLYISSNFANSYQLYDNVTNQYIALDGSVTDYAFTATAGRVNVENRFSIYTPAPATGYNVTLNGYGLATFSGDHDAEIPAGLLKAYTATYVAMDKVLNLVEITTGKIPANTGVILFGTADANYTLPYTTGAAAVGTNHLKPASDFAQSDKNYILSGNMLYQYTVADAVPANKAFLQLPGGAPAPARIGLRFGTATAVESVEAEAVKAEKFIENGQVFIRRGEAVYNLQGQIVK